MTAFLSFIRTTRFASFPDHLVIQIKKFTFGLDWVPKKLGEQRYGYIFVLKTCFGFFFGFFLLYKFLCTKMHARGVYYESSLLYPGCLRVNWLNKA